MEETMKRFFSITCMLLFVASIGCCQSAGGKHKELTIGDTIPAFTLTDQDGHLFKQHGSPGKE